LNTFQWRIRNLTFPADNYLVELNETDRAIIIKTKNKKYFFFSNFISIIHLIYNFLFTRYYKKFQISDLERIQMSLNTKNLSHSFANNTLIISVYTFFILFINAPLNF